MKHLCNCGEIVEVGGEFTKIANCPNCGMYYVDHIVHPHEQELLREIEGKVHAQNNHSDEDDIVEE